MQIENKKMLASKETTLIMTEDSNLSNLTLECNEILLAEQNCIDVNKSLLYLQLFSVIPKW